MYGRQFAAKNEYCPEGYAEGDWRQEYVETGGMQPLSNFGSRDYTRDAKKIRDKFRDYFCGVGSVPWQWNYISSTRDPFDQV